MTYTLIYITIIYSLIKLYRKLAKTKSFNRTKMIEHEKPTIMAQIAYNVNKDIVTIDNDSSIEEDITHDEIQRHNLPTQPRTLLRPAILSILNKCE